MTRLETDEQGFVRESVLQERVDGKVRCNICERRCLLVEGARDGVVPQNKGGTLVTLAYGARLSMVPEPRHQPSQASLRCKVLTTGAVCHTCVKPSPIY
jgi:hypothetical protein